MTTDLGTTLLAARMAHVAAQRRIEDIHRNSAWPIRYNPATGECASEAPPKVRAEIDHLQSVSRAYIEGCRLLAMTDPIGVEAAGQMFEEALRLVREKP